MPWTDKLPEDVARRLGNCHSSRKDIEILVRFRWAAMKEAGKQEQGFTKEDALVEVLDLLDSNGQFFDLTRSEYDTLKSE